jgi:hypothetical protein
VKDGGRVIPVSLEYLIDSGNDPQNIYAAMLDEMRAESRAKFDALPWRTRFMRRQVMPRWYTTRWRLAHASRALRGIECERD